MATKTNWTLDEAHSEITFKVRHLMISNVKGEFGSFGAEVQTEGDDFSTANVSLVIQATSLNTRNNDRDNHLRSADFFDVENHKEIKFQSTSVKKIDEENFVLDGDLIIRGTTKNISLKAEFGGLVTDPWGNTKAGFTVSGKINRKDWGLNWNTALEAGGVLVGDEVTINAEIELYKPKG